MEMLNDNELYIAGNDSERAAAIGRAPLSKKRRLATLLVCEVALAGILALLLMLQVNARTAAAQTKEQDVISVPTQADGEKASDVLTGRRP